MAWLSPDLQCLSQAAKHSSAVLSKLSKGRLTHTDGWRGGRVEGRSPCEGGLPQGPLHSMGAGFTRVSQEGK